MSQRNPLRNPKLNREFFKNLPSEIIINILSRLPVRTIIHCKCVCKSWLDLVETHEFAKSHLSKSVPGLTIFRTEYQFKTDTQLQLYETFEFVDRLDVEHHELHYSPLTKFSFPYHGWIHGSANGLLFLRDQSLEPEGLFVCNPITHDYIKLHCPQEFVLSDDKQVITYGFGASKITGQHKVVRIFQDFEHDQETLESFEPDCQVYTLGTGLWRQVAPAGDPLEYGGRTTGAFLNGNLHWLVFDLSGQCISCFDLETELFSTFSSPPLPGSREFVAGLFTFGDCLCLCDSSSHDEIVIWLMKEYGAGESWTKGFVIRKILDFGPFKYGTLRVVCPLKVFKDGDILMAFDGLSLFYYSKKTKTFDRFALDGEDAILYTPSFLSLKSFAMENVSSL